MRNLIETIEYGEIMNYTLLKIFGDEMTYNELKFYAKNQGETTYLKIDYNRNTETQLVRVWFNNKEVMDKKYCINHSCDMFYLLSEIESELEEEEEEEDKEEEEAKIEKINKKIEDINPEWFPKETPQLAQEKWIFNSGNIDKDFYENYIKNELSKSAQKKMNIEFVDDESYIPYYSTYINNPTKFLSSNTYSVLFLFDINLPNGKYLPVVIDYINTSSCLAMVMSEMNNDDDGEEQELNLDGVLEFIPNEFTEIFKKRLLAQPSTGQEPL